MIQYNIYFGLTTKDGYVVTPEQKTAAFAAISAKFNCFTVLESFGYWNGAREDSVKIEIILDGLQDASVASLSDELAQILDQEAVLYTRYILDRAELLPKVKPSQVQAQDLNREQLQGLASQYGLNAAVRYKTEALVQYIQAAQV